MLNSFNVGALVYAQSYTRPSDSCTTVCIETRAPMSNSLALYIEFAPKQSRQQGYQPKQEVQRFRQLIVVSFTGTLHAKSKVWRRLRWLK